MRTPHFTALLLAFFSALASAQDTCKITESLPKVETKGSELEFQSERGDKCRVYRVRNKKDLRTPARWKADGDVFLDLVLAPQDSNSVTLSFGSIAKGNTSVCTGINRDKCQDYTAFKRSRRPPDEIDYEEEQKKKGKGEQPTGTERRPPGEGDEIEDILIAFEGKLSTPTVETPTINIVLELKVKKDAEGLYAVTFSFKNRDKTPVRFVASEKHLGDAEKEVISFIWTPLGMFEEKSGGVILDLLNRQAKDPRGADPGEPVRIKNPVRVNGRLEMYVGKEKAGSIQAPLYAERREMK